MGWNFFFTIGLWNTFFSVLFLLCERGMVPKPQRAAVRVGVGGVCSASHRLEGAVDWLSRPLACAPSRLAPCYSLLLLASRLRLLAQIPDLRFSQARTIRIWVWLCHFGVHPLSHGASIAPLRGARNLYFHFYFRLVREEDIAFAHFSRKHFSCRPARSGPNKKRFLA